MNQEIVGMTDDNAGRDRMEATALFGIAAKASFGWQVAVSTPHPNGGEPNRREFWVGEQDKAAAEARVRDLSLPVEHVEAQKPLFMSELDSVGGPHASG